MTSIHHAHHHSSPHLKKSAAKSHRPALPKSLSSPKLAVKGGRIKLAEEQLDKEDEDDGMAASFLQYCAMCEKQIIVPNNSILYCSESCRRKDGNKTFAADSYLKGYSTTTMPTSPEPMDVFGLTTRSIVARRRPTVLSNDISKPPLLHHFKSDLDPTEWKPDLVHRSTSEANNYLSQFHRSPPGVAMTRRSAWDGRSTTSALMMAQTAPSLSHTPTTSMTSSEGSIAGTPYEFVASLDTSEGHGTACSGSGSTKTVEAVTPAVTDGSPPSPIKETKTLKKNRPSPVIGDMVYEKKWVSGSVEHVTGSLKKLLYLQQIGEVGGSVEM
ncbi:hypothetical protein MMC11_002287 [Xylographa trunciseda]|nr:hypothetical protein [Xylographa trunciseda]